jgi:hypothetical protein
MLRKEVLVAIGDVVEFEKLPPETAAWLFTKDKYNLPMFSYVCQAETKAQQRTQCSLLLAAATILPNAILPDGFLLVCPLAFILSSTNK